MSTDEKIDRIYKTINEIKIHMATSEVHRETHAKDIAMLKETTSKHEADRNKAYGFLFLGSILWTAFWTWLMKGASTAAPH